MATQTAPNAPTPAVIQQYRELIQESQRLASKISDMELDRNEHRLVEETLRPLDPERRAYRMIGEVLVERTVKEVLPSVTANREQVSVSKIRWASVKFYCVSHSLPATSLSLTITYYLSRRVPA